MSAKKAERITVNLDDYRDKPTVLSKLPLYFGNGARITSFTGSCADCKRKIPMSEFRGDVVSVQDEDYRRSSVKFWYFDVHGYCERCNLLTPFKYGVNDDFTLIGVDNGFLNIYGPPKKTWWRRIWTGLKAWWQKIPIC